MGSSFVYPMTFRAPRFSANVLCDFGDDWVGAVPCEDWVDAAACEAVGCDVVGCDAVDCDAVACDWVVTLVCVFCFGACGLSRPLLRGGGLSGLSSLSAIKSLK